MAKGISISMAADTRAFITGVQKGVINPLDDAAEIIEDLGKDGSRDFDKLEDSMRDAQRETDDTRKKFSDLQKEIRETGRKSRTDFANPVKNSTDDVKRDLDEVRNEAKQNAAEMFSSFDGSFESIADAAQGTLGGLTAGLGGIPGIAAVAAGAAGLGLIMKALEDQDAKAQESAERVSSMYDAMLESGVEFLRNTDKVSFIESILGDTDQRKKAQEEADRIGVTLTDYLLAQFDIGGKREQVEAKIAEHFQEQIDLMSQAGPGYEERQVAALGVEAAEAAALEELLKYDKAQKEAAEIAAVREAAVGEIGDAEREQIKRTSAADQARYDGLAERYREAAARGPIPIRTELEEPDTEGVRRGIENSFNRRPARVQARVFARNGTEVF